MLDSLAKSLLRTNRQLKRFYQALTNKICYVGSIPMEYISYKPIKYLLSGEAFWNWKKLSQGYKLRHLMDFHSDAGEIQSIYYFCGSQLNQRKDRI
jgi:hypothetical protein